MPRINKLYKKITVNFGISHLVDL